MSRLAIDATTGVTGLVEALHLNIVGVPARLAGPVVEGAVAGIPRLVYRSIHGVTRAVGSGLDMGLARIVAWMGHVESSRTREAMVAALNGVLGDHLSESDNPLAVTMQFRCDGKPLEVTPDGLARAFPTPSVKVLVLVHGLCMNDLQWARQQHDHGRALARDLGYASVYLHYNTGRHVSTNGRALAAMLESLVAAWPVPVAELAILGHSMGGLVARSAHHYGMVAGHRWPCRLRKLVFLGTPHHGAPLERGGHRLHRLVEATPYTEPFARLGKIRSAGITDLRHGNLLDEDWQGRDRFAHGDDARRPVPLPADVDCFTIGATKAMSPDDLPRRLLGDGLVPLASALGRHREPRFTLAFPETNRWIASGTGHFELLSRRAVYDRIHGWLAL